MDFKQVIKSETTNLDLKSTTKEEVLAELTDLLFEAGVLNDREVFLKDVYDREKISSTGIGSYVAIPHGKSSAVNKTFLAIGRTNNDIEWQSLDGLPVRFIILFAVREEDKDTTHIKLLAKIAGTLADEDVCKKLLTVESKEEIISIFSGEKS